MRQVIIGNSAAGISAAETIRSLDPNCSITIISDEDYPAYSRCLTPEFMAGNLSEERLRIRGNNFYLENKIKTKLGVKVVTIDAQNNVVILQNGDTVSYDKLLIATGSITTYPPIEGVNLPGVFGLRTLGDAKAILQAAEKARRVVVIGAGLVGLETAYALYRRGLEVTVVEKAPRILSQQFDNTASQLLQRDMEAEGIRLILGTGIKSIAGPTLWARLFRSKGNGVVLENNNHLKCELVVVATGAKPNLDLVRDSGIQIKRGIVVNNLMQTNIPNIYAAGDVAETLDLVTGLRGVTPIWPNAVVQGKYAAYNMVGQERKYNGLIGMQNAVEFRDVPAIAIGITQAEDKEYEILKVYRPEQNLYKKLVIKNDVIKGMIFVGDINNAGVIAALIRNKSNIAKVKSSLLRDDFSYGFFLETAVKELTAS